MSDPSTKRRRLNGPSEHDESNSDSSSAENDLDEKSPNSSTLPKQSRPQNGANPTNRFSDVSRATGLSKSSLFKLQTDELLAGLRPDYDKLASSVQAQLRQIRDILQQIPERPSKRADVAAKELKDQYRVSMPYPCHSSEQELAKYHVSFQPPASIDLVGNLCLRAGSQATELSNVDIAVTIPATLFHPKDYRNYKYFQKRAFYIACIAANLRKAKLPFSMQYDYQDGDSLRPIVVLTPSNTASEESVQQVCIRIFTAVEDDLFPVARTLPSKNNIRRSDAEDEPQTQEENSSSPYYNSILRFESTIIPYHKWLQNSLKKYAAMRDASLLGQTWLRQRGFESSIEKGGFGGFEWMMVLALLFEGGGANGKPVLLPSYSSYQIFKATLQFLAARDLMKPLSLFADNVQFLHGGPTFFDGKRSLNILYKMTKGSYKLLRYECTLTLSLLNETRFDNFEKIFIFRSADPMLKFDRLVSFVLQGDNVDHLNSVRFENHVYDILERSLGDRAKVICLWAESRSPQPLKSKSLYEATSQKMTIGLILNADHANRLVDHGPAAEMQEEAAAFRAFWGEKAELRRFRDGSILESVVWSDQGTVVDQILVYSLSRHLKIPQTSIKCVGDEFDQTLQHLAGPEKKCAAIFQDIRNAFQSLQSSFQNVDDIPLQIRQIQPASPFLRNTAEIQDPKNMGLASIDINLQLESSAKWPDYLDAIQVTKTAFLLRIGEALKNNGAITSYRVGLENENKVFQNRAFLDMAHTTGIRFRLRIHHEREQTLLERKLKESGLSPHFKEDVGRALFEYKKSFIHTPRITQAIQTLSSKLPLLSPTIRLVKRWFSSQLLLSHITEEFVELLVINTFISTNLWASPSSLLSGFYRTLTVLSKWDWQREPLVIDLGSLTADDVKDIETRFQAWRNIDPATKKVAMIIASDLDHDGVTWTLNEKPPKVVAGHITRLAKAAVEALKHHSETKDEQTKLETLLFRPSLSPYDFVIHLKDLNAKGKKHNVQQFANLKNSAANLSTIAEASSSRNIAMSYLEELQTIFGHCILFFHSASENVIAGLWKPASTSAKPLNLKIAYSTRPVLNDDSTPVNVILNKESVLNEIARLGGDLVRSVELKNV